MSCNQLTLQQHKRFRPPRQVQRVKVEDPVDKSPGRNTAGLDAFPRGAGKSVGKIGWYGIRLSGRSGRQPPGSRASPERWKGSCKPERLRTDYGGDGCGDGKHLADGAAFFIDRHIITPPFKKSKEVLIKRSGWTARDFFVKTRFENVGILYVFQFFKPQDWRKRSVVRGRGFIQRFPKV